MIGATLIVETAGTVQVRCPRCSICGMHATLELTRDEWARLTARREAIQAVLPLWPAPQRELLMSGTHPACWDVMWKDAE